MLPFNRFLKRYYRIWLPIVSVTTFLACAEFVCRQLNPADYISDTFSFYVRHVDNDIRHEFIVEDPHLMWRLMPGYENGAVKINSDGFRDREYTIAKKENTFRIVVLGDSSTFGFGVESLSQTYHSLLEKRLNEEFNSGINYEVINGGVPGYTSYQGVQNYKYNFVKYNPDIVAFYFGINDPVTSFHRNDKQIIECACPETIERLDISLSAGSSFYKFYKKSINITAQRIKVLTLRKIRRVSLEDYRNNIIEMHKLCRENGSDLILISPLLNNQCRKEIVKEIALYREELEKTAYEYGIPILTINFLTEKAKEPNNMYFFDSVHPNENGNMVLMEYLFDFLVKNKYLYKEKQNP